MISSATHVDTSSYLADTITGQTLSVAAVTQTSSEIMLLEISPSDELLTTLISGVV
jgi:hypothetical protein